MDGPLDRFPLSLDVKLRLWSSLWKECRPNRPPGYADGVNSSYFEFYSCRCQHFLRDGRIHVLLKTHAEIVAIATSIIQDRTRDTMRSDLRVKYSPSAALPRDDAINTSIDLCANILLMAEIGTHKYGFSGMNPLPWAGQQTLRQAVHQYFQPEKRLSADNPRIRSLFTARNINHISGIKIKWTENIVDHLLLTDDDQTLFVFHCVSFLKHHQRCSPSQPEALGTIISTNKNSFAEPIFPDGLVGETLRTLTLLFPANDRKSRLWLRSLTSSDERIDKDLLRVGSLRSHERRFENFSYWHDRLVILKQEFDDSTPRTLSQWWNDRRNSVQWYTFWVAILVFIMTVFFGVVQSVEGALQVYLSLKALET